MTTVKVNDVVVNDMILGSHVGFNKNIHDTIKPAINAGLNAVQFFMGSPQSFNRTKITDTDIEKSLGLLKTGNFGLFTHFPYVANLAGSKNSLAWKNDKIQNDKTSIVLKNLEYEIERVGHFCDCKNNNYSGVVIHPGNNVDTLNGLLTISKSINKIDFKDGGMLLLENSVGGGTTLCGPLSHLKTIIDNVDEDKRHHIGVVIDTCHLFCYGDYDISKVSEIQRFFKEFDEIIGMHYLKLFHLNDSEKPFKSKVDRHANLGYGCIWKESIDSLKELVRMLKVFNIPTVLETPSGDITPICVLSNQINEEEM